GIGPVIHNPVQTKQDIEQLGTLDPKRDIPYVLETIELLTKEQLHVPLIGFSGAPFTLASYMIEGGPSKTHAKTKAFMYKNEEAWFLLMNTLADMIITYTKAQIEAGVSAIQILDSWIGALNEADYRYFIKPVMEKILAELKPMGEPLILFGIHTRHRLRDFNELYADVIGMD